MTAETVFVRSASGTITQMDVPTNPHARERYEQSLASGTLALIDAADVVERPSRHGGVIFVHRNQVTDDAPGAAPASRQRSAKPRAPKADTKGKSSASTDKAAASDDAPAGDPPAE